MPPVFNALEDIEKFEALISYQFQDATQLSHAFVCPSSHFIFA